MPRVSVILPIYNRVKFLPQAFASIRGQTFDDWELVVVDDGSTDDSRAAVAELDQALPGRVRYIFQQNQGPYAARNTGLDAATGDHVAFFDSDDVWQTDYLERATAVLAAEPAIDWVFCACRVVDLATGATLDPTTFYVAGKPKPFMALHHRHASGAEAIDDHRACEWMLRYGFPCGLQNSVIRRHVFDGNRLEQTLRNEAEDRLILIRSLKRGVRFAYLDRTSVLYHVHGDHSSAAGTSGNAAKRITIQKSLIKGYEALGREVLFTPAERRAWRIRLAREYFWGLGYSLHWQQSDRVAAIDAFKTGLQFWPWDIRNWKTYVLARLRTAWKPTTPLNGS